MNPHQARVLPRPRLDRQCDYDFSGSDFVAVNWFDEFYFPVIAEIRRVTN